MLRLAERIGPDGAADQGRRGRAGASRGRREGPRRGPSCRPRTCWRSPPRRCATPPTPPRCWPGSATETGVDLQVLSGEDEARHDVPRGAAVVRLVGRAAAGARHRRRLAGDRGRHRRGAGRRAVAAAGRRPADPGAAAASTGRRRRRRRRARSRSCRSTSTSALDPVVAKLAEAGWDRPVRHVEDVPHAGPAGRRRAVGGRPAGAARS